MRATPDIRMEMPRGPRRVPVGGAYCEKHDYIYGKNDGCFLCREAEPAKPARSVDTEFGPLTRAEDVLPRPSRLEILDAVTAAVRAAHPIAGIDGPGYVVPEAEFRALAWVMGARVKPATSGDGQ